MKTKFMTVMALAAAMTACQNKSEKTENEVPVDQAELGTGLHLEDMDTTYLAGTDFYMYATGGWQKANPLTAEYSRYGSFDVLSENNMKQLQGLIDSVAAQKNLVAGSVEQKIADLYNSAMDSVRLNSEDAANELRTFLACENYGTPGAAQQWISEVWPRMQQQGVGGMFGVWIGADEKDSKNNIVNIMQGGLTLGNKDYYVEEDAATRRIREAYVQYIVNLSKHDGFSEADAKKIAADVMRIETRIARASKSNTELRDPEANYNKFTYAELLEQFGGIDWAAHFGVFGIKDGEVKNVVVGQVDAIHEVEKILAEETPEALQNLYLWHAMDMTSSYIDDEARAIEFAFSGTVMSGKTEDRPRWKRAVGSVEGGLGEALGQIYVNRYFPAAAKTRMEKLVKNLQIALGERIAVQEWMSPETKKVAQEKLDAFYVKVGYPNKWKDYSSLEIGKSYLCNMLAVNEWEIKDMIETKLNKPVDKDEWHMTPQTVNAYYNPTTNEICFPAGILQPPFFDMTADDAFNYGAIGVVIGHEMTHGFDDQGSQYDKDGNLHQWWSDEDTKNFKERIAVMRDYHDAIEVLPGLHANGSFTLGENMADHGGLMVAFQALQNANEGIDVFADQVKDGFTPAQRFFLAYAGVWGQNIREAEIQKRVKSDPHQLGKWRVDGQLPHVEAWYKAFGITEKDPMYLPVEKRVTIW